MLWRWLVIIGTLLVGLAVVGIIGIASNRPPRPDPGRVPTIVYHNGAWPSDPVPVSTYVGPGEPDPMLDEGR
jgi:hypothetical protein